MTIYEPGTVVDVPFPFIKKERSKTRPALVLSSPTFQSACGACVLAMITSAERSAWPNDVLLADWRGAGLRKPSLLRWKIFTLDDALILGVRGALSPADWTRVRASFDDILPNQNPIKHKET
jgi:mRNA interferase MazF